MRALVTSKIITCKLLFTLLFFILLTLPDNKVSDTMRKKVYMHLFTGVQAGTPQQQAPITVGPKRMHERVACFCSYVLTILRAFCSQALSPTH